MKSEETAQRELARQLIEAMGADNARDIARRNCWKGVFDELEVLDPASATGLAPAPH